MLFAVMFALRRNSYILSCISRLFNYEDENGIYEEVIFYLGAELLKLDKGFLGVTDKFVQATIAAMKYWKK
jgi:hypothetical protein